MKRYCVSDSGLSCLVEVEFGVVTDTSPFLEDCIGWTWEYFQKFYPKVKIVEL